MEEPEVRWRCTTESIDYWKGQRLSYVCQEPPVHLGAPGEKKLEKDWGGPFMDPAPISAGNRELKNGFEQEKTSSSSEPIIYVNSSLVEKNNSSITTTL